jgi:hypothetical protein
MKRPPHRTMGLCLRQLAPLAGALIVPALVVALLLATGLAE